MTTRTAARRLLLLLLCAAVAAAASSITAAAPSITDEFLALPTNTSLAEALLTLTHRSHIAGSAADEENARFVADKFREAGLDDVSIPSYSLFLSYPGPRRALTAFVPGHPWWAYNASLQEPAFPDDPYSGMADVTPTFHGYSPSGNVRGPIVYANYGRQEDFDFLHAQGIRLNGTIVLARYGQNYRGAKVRNAERYGAVGVLLYSDPHDYNPTGAAPYPEGPGLPLGGVQRGSVVGGAGDPLTPGWPSARVDLGMAAERVELDDARTALPRIPSLPISAADALPLLEAMEGVPVPRAWVGGLEDTGVYKVGRGPVIARLDIEMENRQVTVWNVVGVMKGAVEPDRYVVLGNHRDAWTFGAVDPNSGTACLLEIARALGELRRTTGWRPRRSIVLASWDAEEHCLGGSTEWAEEHALLLQSRGIAYLNVDSAVAGAGFWASATPSLDKVVWEASKRVPDPDAKWRRTLFDTWSGALGRLGDDGSDHGVFVQHLGLPATLLGWNVGDYPMYHSTYDDYAWMSRFGDVGFHRHVAATQVWGLVTLALADTAVLPLDYVRYGEVLEGYVRGIWASLVTHGDVGKVDLRPMEDGLRRLQEAAKGVERERRQLLFRLGEGEEEEEDEVWLSTSRRLQEESGFSAHHSFLAVRELNDRLMLAERGFLDDDGLQGPGQEAWRSWLKHLVYSPPNDNEYGTSSFPGVNDAIARAQKQDRGTGEEEEEEEGKGEAWKQAQHEVWRAGRALDRVAGVLRGSLL